ncbi:MAG: carboxylesterase family protein [Clostridiales bacterium]|nr:carboxylesterase family protein [Clostridiales bacterium]
MLRQTTTENGRVAGIPAADPRITAYKGIPFAAPPVGNLRWKPPQKAADWSGVLNADKFAPISMQSTPGIGDPEFLYNKEWHVDSKIDISEDCLYLNVWTPAKTGDEKFPVMVWIYGGGLQWGYSSEMEFDGERIARRGIVFVSLNYRLNVFGFLAHPEISAEGGGTSGNFGLMDQLAAMKWVKRNIASFGGDPDNVTIFGQSAGGGSVMAHLASPESGGYFHKAIAQSCGGIARGPFGNMSTLNDAEKTGEAFFKWAGISNLEEARSISSEKMLDLGMSFKSPTGRHLTWGIVTDGVFLKEPPAKVISENRRHPVPLMIGNTSAEFLVSPPGDSEDKFIDFANKRFGKNAEKYLSLTGLGKVSLEEAVKAGTFNGFDVGNRLWGLKNAQLKTSPLYYYRFSPEIPGDNEGAFHSSELWFMFETLAKCWRPFVGKHYDLARQMCNYWTNFAKTGNPNGNDADGSAMPQWSPFTEDSPYAMLFGEKPEMDKSEVSELTAFLIENETAARA